MKVFIVTTHWHYDSSDINGVCLNYKKARKMVVKVLDSLNLSHLSETSKGVWTGPSQAVAIQEMETNQLKLF